MIYVKHFSLTAAAFQLVDCNFFNFYIPYMGYEKRRISKYYMKSNRGGTACDWGQCHSQRGGGTHTHHHAGPPRDQEHKYGCSLKQNIKRLESRQKAMLFSLSYSHVKLVQKWHKWKTHWWILLQEIKTPVNINLSEISITNFLSNFNKAETLKKVYLEYVEFVVYFLIKSCELIIFVFDNNLLY